MRIDESDVIHTSSQRANAACVLPLPAEPYGTLQLGFLIASNETPAREVIYSYLDLPSLKRDSETDGEESVGTP